jgi:hypothetical protein
MCGRNVSGVTNGSTATSRLTRWRSKIVLVSGVADARRAKLYFDYTVPLLENMTAAAKLGAKEYLIFYA